MTWLKPGEPFPSLSHRHMGLVMADEALCRRQRARHLANTRERGRRWRERHKENQP